MDTELKEGQDISSDNTVENQKPWLFKKGQSGNPAGKPKGTISIISKIKRIFEENPEYFEEYVTEILKDSKMRHAVMVQIDGMPKQKTDLNVDGTININVVNYKNDGEEKG